MWQVSRTVNLMSDRHQSPKEGTTCPLFYNMKGNKNKISKNIVIILGMRITASPKEISVLKQLFGKNLFIFTPRWKYHSMSHWVAEYESFLQRNQIINFTAIGFSMGGCILANSNTIASRTIYASMSPLFKNYLERWPKKWLTYLGKKRTEDTKEFLRKPNSYFIFGDMELEFIKASNRELSKDKNLIVVPGVAHEFFNKEYLGSIKNILEY